MCCCLCRFGRPMRAKALFIPLMMFSVACVMIFVSGQGVFSIKTFYFARVLCGYYGPLPSTFTAPIEGDSANHQGCLYILAKFGNKPY